MAVNLFSLVGSIMVDNTAANNSIAKTDEKASNLATKFKKFASGTKAVAGGIAKVASATSAIAGAAAISAASNYAQFEQLEGGIETLFGDAADKMLEYSSQAFQTAGLSANDYLDTVMGFSASLLQSMEGNTDLAAEKANQAIIDMSDNANKMGSDMQSIQNAYAGFAKQNYNMLDNLKLGYGGTKEEMERLLADANEINKQNGISTEYQLGNYSDIIDAIHTIQTEIGITGTTQKEASSTIEGSLNSIKANFDNMKTQLGSSVAPVFQRFLNMLQEFMPRIQAMVDRLAPVIVGLLDDIMPAITSLAESLLPLIETAFDALLPIFSQVLSTILPVLVELLNKLVPILSRLFEGLMPIFQRIMEVIMPLLDTLMAILGPILDVVLALIDPLLTLLEAILAPILGLLEPLISLLGLISPILEIISAVLKPILELINKILTPITAFIEWIFDGISDGINKITEALGGDGILGALGIVADYIIGGFSDAFDVLGELFDCITEFIEDPKAALEHFFSWVEGTVGKIKETISSIVTSVSDAMDAKKDLSASEGLKGFTSELEARVKAGTIDVNDKAAVNALRRQYGVPELAQGAVLEPNHPFMAIVGDQKHGTNVEAPLSTIQEAVRAELESISFNVMFEVNGDEDQLFRVVKKRSWIEKKRSGQPQMA